MDGSEQKFAGIQLPVAELTAVSTPDNRYSEAPRRLVLSEYRRSRRIAGIARPMG